MFDSPEHNDNRQYDFSQTPELERSEYAIITHWIAPNSRVLDLGCGNGSLMHKLQKEKKCQVSGMELSLSGVEICQSKGLEVIQGSIDTHLPWADDSFDVAICNVTIQMVMFPEVLVREMKRVAKRQIISFPNFGYYKNRFDLLFTGRMPRKMLFGYTWYNTGHIHQLGIADFSDLYQSLDLKLLQKETTATGALAFLAKISERLFSPISIYQLYK